MAEVGTIEVPVVVTVSVEKDQPTQAEVHIDGPNETTAEQADQRRRRKKIRTVNAMMDEIPDHLEGTTAEKAEVSLLVEHLWKDNAQHLIYGVVLEPDLEDSQGDLVTTDEIQKAAHRFLVESRKTDIQHDDKDAEVSVVESYCAPESTVIAGEPVTKGSWVLVVKVHDPAVWADVRAGNLTGYSIGGSGVRVPVTADA